MIKKIYIGIIIIVLAVTTSCTKNVESSHVPVPPMLTNEISSEEPPPSVEADYFGALHVEGANLVSDKGAIVQLKGISSHNLSVFPQFVNKEFMQQMKEEWGCSVIRLAMYTAEDNGYCTGDDANRELLKERIDNAVNDAQEAGLFVIIDWHMLFDNNPLMYAEEAVAFFSEMAQKYADKDHVIFEICNEPNSDATWADVKAYAHMVIPAIREFSDAVILVGTTSWAKDVTVAAEDPLDVSHNIMYTLHFYAATHKQELRDTMQSALQAGLPIFVSEFGVSEATGDGVIDEAEADVWLELMDTYKVSYVIWNLSNKDESSAIISSGSTKTYGFTAEDLSPAGKWFVAKMRERPDIPPPVPSVSAITDGVDVQVEMESTWQIDGIQYYQYLVTMHNYTDADIVGWSVEVDFDQDIEMSKSWNGVYDLQKQMLLITPKAYNRILRAGAKTKDIGFILKSQEGLEGQDIALQ